MNSLYLNEFMRHKVLLVGSGPYIKEWWTLHHDKIGEVSCMNTAIEVVGARHHRWYLSSDFMHNRQWTFQGMRDRIGEHILGLRIVASFLSTPHWYNCPYDGTMLINSIYDILNRATIGETPVELNLIGCDLDYSKPKTHFYPGGTADPKRIPDEILLGHLHKVEKDFSPMHKIVNLGPQPSFLPFEPGDPDLSWST